MPSNQQEMLGSWPMAVEQTNLLPYMHFPINMGAFLGLNKYWKGVGWTTITGTFIYQLGVLHHYSLLFNANVHCSHILCVVVMGNLQILLQGSKCLSCHSVFAGHPINSIRGALIRIDHDTACLFTWHVDDMPVRALLQKKFIIQKRLMVTSRPGCRTFGCLIADVDNADYKWQSTLNCMKSYIILNIPEPWTSGISGSILHLLELSRCLGQTIRSTQTLLQVTLAS